MLGPIGTVWSVGDHPLDLGLQSMSHATTEQGALGAKFSSK